MKISRKSVSFVLTAVMNLIGVERYIQCVDVFAMVFSFLLCM